MDLITAAIPFFFLLMGVELVVGLARGRQIFRGPDVMNDLALGLLQTIFTVVAAGLLSGMYLWTYEHRLVTLPDTWPTWLLAFVGVDFCYYWFHRASHRVMLAWASHAPHHSSEDYNLAVALRQGPVQPLFSRLFYLPLALVGVSYELFALMVAVNTLYQFWIHTELIGRLGPLEWIFNTPSHHRVHHGCDIRNLDKNHAGIFIVWDRLFGTFLEEDGRPVYGTVKASATWNPLLASWQPFGDIAAKLRHAHGVVDVFRAFFAPPEWLPAGMAAAPAVTGPRPKFDARPARGVRGYAVAWFVLTLALGVGYLLIAGRLDGVTGALVAGWLAVSFGSIGGLLDGRAWATGLEVARFVALIPLTALILRALS